MVVSILLVMTCHWCQAERRRLLFNPQDRRESLATIWHRIKGKQVLAELCQPQPNKLMILLSYHLSNLNTGPAWAFDQF